MMFQKKKYIGITLGLVMAGFLLGFLCGRYTTPKGERETSETVEIAKDTTAQPTETVTKAESVTAAVTTVEETTKKEVVTQAPVRNLKGKKLVALTFDDGPGRYTMELLNILQSNQVRATFFVCGTGLERNDAEKILKRMDSIHCDIGNHTMHHVSLGKAKAKKIKKEINGVDRIVKKYTGHKTKFLRPPYGAGAKKKTLKKNVKVPMICWNVDTLDWKTKSKKKTIKRATKNIHDGDIILMHDIHPWSVKAVKKIIPELRKQGFEFVTISEMAKYKKVSLKKGIAYYDFRGM